MLLAAVLSILVSGTKSKGYKRVIMKSHGQREKLFMKKITIFQNSYDTVCAAQLCTLFSSTVNL